MNSKKARSTGATHTIHPANRDSGLFAGLSMCMLFLALSMTGQVGCCSCYPLKQGYGGLSIQSSSRPIAEVLEDASTPADVRESLLRVRTIRDFAETSIRLEKTGNYETYCQTGDKPVAIMLIACPSDSLQPLQWWFPIAGRFPYLGFFDPADAAHNAAKLKAQGYDVCLRTVAAYSTLGWLQDPVFSPMLRYDEATLANVIIHELTHATIFFPGYTGFNESVATFIGNQGSLDYMSATHGSESPGLASAVNSLHDEEMFSTFMLELSRRLVAAYDAAGTRQARIAAKRVVLVQAATDFAALSSDFAGDDYRDFDPSRLNNALVISYLTYHEHVALVNSIYERHGKNLGGLVRFLRDLPGNSDPVKSCRDWLARDPSAKPAAADRDDAVYAARRPCMCGAPHRFVFRGPRAPK
jgi:predicted aminopeptidase